MALGMMVDNAIVTAESVMVKMGKGIPAKQAAIESCTELFTPLLISTLTTSAAFLAFYMAESIMGDIVGPIFVVISMALLSSWLLSLTMITLLCVLFLKVKPKGEAKPSAVDKVINKARVIYKGLILRALSTKYIVIAGIAGLFVLAVMGFGSIPFLFFPDSDRNMITMDINLQEGVRIERTSEVVAEIEKYMTDVWKVNEERTFGIRDWAAFIGEGPESYDLGYTPDEANSNYAHLLINTSAASANYEMINVLDSFCFLNFPGADIKVSALEAGGGGTPVEIKISGKDPDKLAAISREVKAKLLTIKGTKNVKDDWGPKSKKFVVNIDQNRAQTVGVTSQDIATSLQTMLDGFTTGEYREGDKSIPVMMRGEGGQQQSLEALSTFNIYAQGSGKSVPLPQVAT
ncbi:MAG: efflux RND transporter permease subunit, partial [Bacteroidota bacterium]